MTELIDSKSHEAKADLYLMDCKNLFSRLLKAFSQQQNLVTGRIMDLSYFRLKLLFGWKVD